MIVITKSCDSLLKGIVAPDSLNISKLDNIADQILIDPYLSNPATECFVVTNEDMRDRKVFAKFTESLAQRHPRTLILYISKNGRPIKGLDEELFDRVVIKPKDKEVIRKTFDELVSESEKKREFSEEAIMEQMNRKEDTLQSNIPIIKKKEEEEEKRETLADKKKRMAASGMTEEEVEAALSQEKTEEEESLVKFTDIEDTASQVISDGHYNGGSTNDGFYTIQDRIRAASDWAGITSVVKEISASRVVQETAKVNLEYKQAEQYIDTLREAINATFMVEKDTNVALSKIRAILFDKSTVRAKTNTILEQTVEEIIKLLVDKTSEFINIRYNEVNQAIEKALRKEYTDKNANARLTVLGEEKTKLLMELNSIDLEIKNIAQTSSSTINDTVSIITENSVTDTGSTLLNNKILVQYGHIVPAKVLDNLNNLFNIGAMSEEEFGKMSGLINSLIRKLYAVLTIQKEEQEVLSQTIKYLRAAKVEDTVIAETILKKATRLYVCEKDDFTAASTLYMISRHKARSSSNVLYIDLTGNQCLNHFGINNINYSTFIDGDCIIKDSLYVCDDLTSRQFTMDDCDKLQNRIIHYAKHYSVINLLITPEMTELFKFISPEVLSINFMVDAFPTSVQKYRGIIADCYYENTAYKVIIYNYLTDAAKICSDLDIVDKLYYQLITIATNNEMRLCAYNKQDPYLVPSIVADYADVLELC